ncbi:MAG TPA: DNA-directed RNA polymerase subunit beta', partial [Clostridiaceae bacterium]|nr:DNA-directed RNA polymerase subunit beta' [Clostridiaceae bacterium]
YKGIVCDRCGVEITRSKVRRERMGHIKLAAPVSHIWYFRGIPSRMGLILDMSPRNLEKVLYFANYIVLDSGDTNLTYKQLLTEYEYRQAEREFGRNSFRALMGAEAVKELLNDIDIEKMSEELKEELNDATGQKKVRLIKRLEVVEAFRKSKQEPAWMILDVLPVLPPDLRPMVQLDGGRFATSDLNDLYRRVINRNNRLNKLLDLGAPDIIIRNEKRMLQESVDALIDNGRRGRPVTGAGNRPLKSMSDYLKGKQGRFRQNLLGKRVDYSGRSVIVVGPELKIHQCGLPKEMAVELFKPFVMKRLVQDGHATNIKSAKRLVERATNEVWDILEEVIKDHPVLLNRAPTLHRLGIQAFEPVLVEGHAIKLHPLVCTAYNADFDGDQMAVHVPLSAEAQAEARFLMLSANNLLKPQDGKPVTVPTQDMVLGIYYLTQETAETEDKHPRVFSSLAEADMAYHYGEINFHTRIKVRLTAVRNGKEISQIVESTYGRFLFNQILPQNLGYIDREIPGNELLLEVDFLVDKKKLGGIIERCIEVNGISHTARILDDIKDIGYHTSTRSGISIGVFDMIVPNVKKRYIADAEAAVDKIYNQYQRGLMNESGRKSATIKVWRQTTDDITEALKESLPEDNPIFMMSDSGARGSMSQIKQLAGMRGNMADTSGQTIEIPIKSNLREGMNVLEFFISSHGARKALSDTALKTADSGYLTRRLVDVAQDVIIQSEDCGTDKYIEVSALMTGSSASRRVLKTLHDRIVGRYAALDVLHPETGEIIVKGNHLITDRIARLIESVGIKKVPIRSVLTCQSRHGLCSRCYGLNLATGQPTVQGEAVGVMAAQSIGEPGTQLTMRTFHTGGIASNEDITQGLPRVEELFEARKPKGQAIMAQNDGIVSLEEDAKQKRIVKITDNESNESHNYSIPYSAPLLVEDG